ncbi:hypothetical protein PIROE2DRAFT_11364 [Piromyces sp. E2]|nr:hypothetical protein PIROE2DRAFT_11364 [Piromyces sp. E2]|eukprot:OUM62361.1 hypothetical protein PIROE2DRAFT_11364 [Piromyces sp. E2]
MKFLNLALYLLVSHRTLTKVLQRNNTIKVKRDESSPDCDIIKPLFGYDDSDDFNCCDDYPDFECVEIDGVLRLTTLMYECFSEGPLNVNLPENIGDLDQLTMISLYQCELGGTIPNSILNLKNLQTIELTECGLGGQIPEFDGTFKYLKNIYLGGNELTGSIPESLLEIKSLENLQLNDNKLIGPIPKFDESFTKLGYLQLQSNYLSGNVFSSIANVGSDVNAEDRDLNIDYNCIECSKVRSLESVVYEYPRDIIYCNNYCDILETYLKITEEQKTTNSFTCEEGYDDDSNTIISKLIINGIKLTESNIRFIFDQPVESIEFINNQIDDFIFPSGITLSETLKILSITDNELTKVPDWNKTSQNSIDLSKNCIPETICNTINGRDGL